MNPNDRPVIVVIPGDLHLTRPCLPNHLAALRTVYEINDLIRPDFVQFIGDNVQDGTDEQFALFRDLARRLQPPWYALVGDHDAQGDPEAAQFCKQVGELWGSLSLRGLRFLRLNTQEARPVGLSADQIGWLRAELDQGRAAQERVVLFQHNYPYQIWENFDGPGIDCWRELVQTSRIHAIIAGHTHYWQLANDGRNVLVTTRSIGDPEGGPPGYTVAAFQGEDFAATFRSITDLGPLVLITHPRQAILATAPAHIIRGADEVRVSIWSRDPVEMAGFRIDDEPWSPLQPCGEGRWHAPLAGDRLSKGTHRLMVRAEADSTIGEQEIEFAIDPTGRYTAIPMVRPIITATQFC